MTMGNEEPTMAEESDDQSSVKSDESCGRNRVKILYSYGGRILPRPKDGKLRYVGGQTRVLAANRNITFSDLIAKMEEILGLNVVFKCQLPAEDLDALVSIKSDEDLKNMLEEYDRHGVKERSSKIRAFLFPKPTTTSPTRPQIADRHMDRQSKPPIVQCHDEKANAYVASSNPSEEAYGQPHIHQEPHGLGMYHFTVLNPLCTPIQHPVKNIPSKAARLPRFPPVYPAAQCNSPVKYAMLSATNINHRVTMPLGLCTHGLY